MPRRLTLFALLLHLCGPTFSARAGSDGAENHVQAGRAHLDAAAIGTDGAAERAFAEFEAALAKQPGLAGARAGRGLALIAQALTAPMASKLTLAREGCADLDAAVSAAPEDAAVRLMRATSAMQMPLLLERAAVAESDFAILLAAARDAPVTMAPETRRGVFYQAAAFALKERRPGAVELLEQAASIEAMRPTNEQVQSMLALARRQISPPSHADRHPQEETPSP